MLSYLQDSDSQVPAASQMKDADGQTPSQEKDSGAQDYLKPVSKNTKQGTIILVILFAVVPYVALLIVGRS